jgi:hypothetical protein
VDRQLLGGFLALLAGAVMIVGGLLLGGHHHATGGLALDGIGALVLIAGLAVMRISVGLPKGSPPLFGARWRRNRYEDDDDSDA